jgi:hypothetical protein
MMVFAPFIPEEASLTDHLTTFKSPHQKITLRHCV